MSFATWLMSCFSRRGKALSLYRTGMAKAEKRDYEGAIADYSTAIELAKIPADVKAMALYNRALAYQAIREDTKSNEDLAAVLETPGLPEYIKTAAEQRRKRVQRRSEKANNP